MRDTNREVADTTRKQRKPIATGLSAILDWLEFTVWSLTLPEVIEQLLQLTPTDFRHTGAGAYGYRDKYALLQNEHVTILTNGRDDQGVHVCLSGQGCAYLLQRVSIQTLTDRVLRAGGQFSRVDLALDDKESAWYTVPQLIRHAQHKEIICAWREINWDHAISASKADLTKEIVYMGSARSDLSLKIYNKTLEQQKKPLSPEEGAALPASWTRWEFTCRRKKAQALMLELADNHFALGQTFAALLHGAMRIAKANPADSNRGRWATRQKWIAFIGETQPLKLTVSKPKATIQRSVNWLVKQVIPTLAGVLQTADGPAKVFDLLAESDQSMPAHINAMVQDYNAQLDESVLYYPVRKQHLDYVKQILARCLAV